MAKRLISACGECSNYNWKKHKCMVCSCKESDPRNPFYDDCPLPEGVEIVRCKDCKHMEITPDNLRWCNAWNSINGMGDEGYCNYGKRKGGQAPQREDVCGSD